MDTTTTNHPAPVKADRYQPLRDAIAAGPTPGPWGLKDGRTDTIENDQGYPVCTVHHHPYERYGHGVRAAYIAAADPDTIAALLKERDALRAAIERLVEIADRDPFQTIGFIVEHVVDLRAVLAEATQGA